MYSPNSPRRYPPGLAPQSDGRRLVFPLSQYNGTFKTENFIPSLVDNRCSLDDINYFLNDLYFTTKRMSPIRKTNRMIIWSFVLYIFCFIFGCMIEMDNSDYEYADDMDDSGILLIFGGIFFLLIINIIAVVYRSASKAQLYKQVVTCLERHKYHFLQRGLRWSVPENCNWLELWMDYRYFSPYYLQHYVPAGLPTLQRVNSQGYAIPVMGQPQPQVQTQPQTATAAHNQTLPVNNNTVEGQDHQVLNNEQDIHNNRVQVPNSTMTAIPMQIQAGYPSLQPFPQPFPQQFVPQATQQHFGNYQFYQPPTLNENLLSFQENDNLRLLRPY